MEKSEKHKLRIAMEYLHESLLNNSISSNTESLKLLGFDIKTLEGKSFSDLSKIRDKLLDQVKFSK